MSPNHQSRGPGESPPTSDKADGANVGRVGEQCRNESSNSRSAAYSEQALQVIEGEAKARAYIERLQSQQADPDELALIVAKLYGATLRGFCRAIAKALGARHE